jgi:gliding motility-associated-like protein
VTVPEPLDASFAADSLGGCYPFTVEFAGNESSLQSIAEAQWTFGDGGTSGSLGSSFHTYIEEGVWTVSLTLTSVEGCVYSETAPQFITTVRPPEARFSADPVIQTLPETRFEFNNYSVFASGQTWNFAGLGESEAWEPVFVFPQDQSGDYPVTLVVWNEWGCKDSLRQIVRVNEQFTMFIPTGFTPDQDGLNDAWTFYGIDVDETDFHLVVFDRWGSIVFETRDLNDAWVGDFQGGSHYAENGVYAYQVITRSLSTGERKWLTGSVTLTR